MRGQVWGAALATIILISGRVAPVLAQHPDLAPEDVAYIEKFHEHYPKVDPAPTLEQYAAIEQFDRRFLGEPLDKAIEVIRAKANDQGNLAWGAAYWMAAYNLMYRNTREARYLEANGRCIDAVLAVRDDKKGTQLFTGEIAPAWSSDKYAKRGRAVFGVHTGVIVYPILDWLLLVKEKPDLLSPDSERYAAIRTEALQALAWHDKQWRNGPGDDEGHYIMMNQEEDCEGKIKPGNRLSALGRALWAAWKLTGDEAHKERALRLGRYIKRRLAIGPDGAYYWPYWLPETPPENPVNPKTIRGEDASHGQLTAAFPLLLAEDGAVFDEEDVKRFGLTVRHGIARLGDGILLGSVTGDPAYDPSYVSSPDGWVVPAWTDPDVRECLVRFYLEYQPNPSALDLAALLSRLPKN